MCTSAEWLIQLGFIKKKKKKSTMNEHGLVVLEFCVVEFIKKTKVSLLLFVGVCVSVCVHVLGFFSTFRLMA